MHIKNRLAAARGTALAEEQVDMNAFALWKDGVKSNAKREARLEVSDEISAHESIKIKLEAERDAAVMKRESAENKVADYELRLQGLQKGFETIKNNWDSTKEALDNKVVEIKAQKEALDNRAVEIKSHDDISNNLKSDLIDEKLITQQLKIKVASLEGELRSSSKVKSVAKQVQIPEFEWTPTRDIDGRAVKWTSKPIRLN